MNTNSTKKRKVGFLYGLLLLTLLLSGCTSLQAPVPVATSERSFTRGSTVPDWRGRTAARPPLQPSSGPGSPTYAHSDIQSKEHEIGTFKAWTFEPQQPTPENAPVVVLLHHTGSNNPLYYRAWIDHLVRRGNIVLFPTFQLETTAGKDVAVNALVVIKAALTQLNVRPDMDRMAFAGHGIGGTLAANLAAISTRHGLPAVRALMLIAPAPCPRLRCEQSYTERDIPAEEYSQIPSDTRMLVLVSSDDPLANETWIRLFWSGSTQIAAADRDFITISNDTHGTPALIADNFFPTAPILPLARSEVNALDWYGTWKLFDALSDCAFANINCEYALGNTPQQRFMGIWSDSIPVKELKVTENP